MNRIKEYIENLFSQLPNTNEARDMKKELLTNSIDKYNDLIDSGVDSQEAVTIVIDGIGKIDDWRQAFPKEDNPKQDYLEFDEFMKMERKRKKKTRAIILSVVVVLVVMVISSILLYGNFGPLRSEHSSIDVSDSINGILETKSTQSFYQHIEVNSTKYNIVIEYSDSIDKVNVELTTTIEDGVLLSEHGDQLLIETEYEKMSENKIFNGFSTNYRGTILVTLPKDATREIEINQVSGSITINGNVDENLTTIEINAVSSDIQLDNVDMGRLTIDTVSSNIQLNDCWINTSVEVNGVSSEMSIYVSKEHPKFNVSMDSMSGKYTDRRSSEGKGQVDLSYDSVSGNLSIFDSKTEK